MQEQRTRGEAKGERRDWGRKFIVCTQGKTRRRWSRVSSEELGILNFHSFSHPMQSTIENPVPWSSRETFYGILKAYECIGVEWVIGVKTVHLGRKFHGGCHPTGQKSTRLKQIFRAIGDSVVLVLRVLILNTANYRQHC